MSDSTYQYKESSVPLECYEWDRTWIAHTENQVAKRIFYIGDSISWDGIRGAVQRIVKDEFYIDALATSKALDNPSFLPTLDLMLRQVRKPDLILFNNGLHGWHLKDDSDYPELFEKFLLAIWERIDVPVAVVLTTRVANEDRHRRVLARNRSAQAVAEKLGCPVIDLYTRSEEFAHLQGGDGVHYSGEGYTRMAEAILPELRNLLN